MKKRILYIDVLRILACIAVIFNHASGYFLFGEQEPGSFLYRLEMGISIGCKFAVPVFFAISGALMLDREIALGELFRKRIVKIALAFFVFSIVSYMADVLQDRTALDVKAMLFRLYEDNLNFSYWYLYAYMAFLLISPMLGAMLRNLRDHEILYMLALAFAVRCAIPAFEAWRWAGAHRLNADFSLACISCDIVLYPSMGYFLHHRLSVRDCRRWAPVLATGAALSVLMCIELTLQAYYRTWVPKMEPVTEPAALLLGAAVFAAARALLGECQGNGLAARLVTCAGTLTFGVYLVHVPVLHSEAMAGLMGMLRSALPLPMMIMSLIEVLLTMFASAAIVALLKSIPGVRRLL